jgi:hypothetical protein
MAGTSPATTPGQAHPQTWGDVDLDKTTNIGLYSYLSRPDERGVRDRHDSRGGMRWTRQRRAGTRVAGRKPGGRARALYKGCAQGPEAREGPEVWRTTTLRGANRGGDVPHWHRLARRPKSCGPAKSGLLFACLQPQARSTAETTASGFDRCRGEHEASRKPTACGTPDVSGAFVVTNSCACFLCA